MGQYTGVMSAKPATPSKTVEKEASPSKSIIRTVEVLEQFAIQDELGIKEISEGTGMPASTVQRIVNTLESRNFLKQDAKSLKYRLGMAFFNISGKYSHSNDWIELITGHLEKFVEKHKETANCAILRGYKIAYLTKVDSPHILRPNFTVGTIYPSYCTSLGRSMLAFKQGLDVEDLLAQSLEPHERAPGDVAQLRAALDKIRADGYAMEDEEFQPGIFCIGAPVMDANGLAVAAISTSIPKVRLDIAMVPTIIKDIRDTASAISRDLDGFFDFLAKPPRQNKL